MADETPLWAKLLLYGGALAGGFYVVYRVITDIVLGPIKTYHAMWVKQYTDLVNKMANYTISNPEGWTAAQQENVNQEQKILDVTTAGLANASSGLYDMVVEIAAVLGGIGLAAVVIKAIIDKFKSSSGGTVRTAAGAGYIAICSFSQHIANNGFPVYATDLIATSTAMFEALDAPYMTQQIASIQALLPTLTGIQLIVAQQEIEALSIEMMAIRALLQTMVFP